MTTEEHSVLNNEEMSKNGDNCENSFMKKKIKMLRTNSYKSAKNNKNDQNVAYKLL